MPIGIVSDADFEKELGKVNEPRPIEAVVVDKPHRGRDEGDTNVPDSLRQIIGETSVIEGRQEAIKLAREFGISASSVSAYAKGATSTTSYNNPTKSIINHIQSARRKVSSKAQGKLNEALEYLTPDKMENVRARDLASIAKDMSVIIKNMEPSNGSESEGTQPQYVIFAPQFRDERSFEFIKVDE